MKPRHSTGQCLISGGISEAHVHHAVQGFKAFRNLSDTRRMIQQSLNLLQYQPEFMGGIQIRCPARFFQGRTETDGRTPQTLFVSQRDHRVLKHPLPEVDGDTIQLLAEGDSELVQALRDPGSEVFLR